MVKRMISVGVAAFVLAGSFSVAAFAQYVPYQGPGYGPGCGPAGYYGCSQAYRGPDRGPPGAYGGRYYRPYAGPGNGPPRYVRRSHRYDDWD